MKNIFSALLNFIFFGLLPLYGEILRDGNGKPLRYGGKFSSAKINIRDTAPRQNEFRGIWVAVVENIDFPLTRSEAEFKQAFRQILKNSKAAGFTAIIFQIRSNCDAFYPTRFAPWSRWLSGKEGFACGKFDPLRFMVDETHRYGMEFHAWFNPYRVTNNTPLDKNSYLKTLAPDNFARLNPECVLVKKHPHGNQLFLDPGHPEVIRHLCLIVREVAMRYPVDAIHFDDYFYPYEKMVDEDRMTFQKYNTKKLSLDDWRRRNTELLIYNVKLNIDRVNKAQKRHIRFGVSPFGIWANRATTKYGSLTGGKESYTTLFADTRKWVKSGYLDYIAPQIYWNFNHDAAAYAALTDWWCQVVRGTNTRLYIGMGAYNGGKWQSNELVNQLRYNRMRQDISGAAFFSYRSFFGKECNRGALNLLKFINAKPKY